MEHETDARTAVDLKRRIDNVIYVVTSDSIKSVWRSWDIGYTDCSKGVEDVAIWEGKGRKCPRGEFFRVILLVHRGIINVRRL